MKCETASEVGELFTKNQPPAVQARFQGLIFEPQDGAGLLGRHTLNIAKHDRCPIDGRQGEDGAKYATAELRSEHLLIGQVAPVGDVSLRRVVGVRALWRAP